MKDEMWLIWSRKLLSVAQTGLNYAKNVGEKERYNDIQDVALEMLSLHANIEKKEIKDNLYLQKGYCTPQITVRGIIKNEASILLVKERNHMTWNLPGGYAEINLSPSESIKKEILEEIGISSNINRLLAIYENYHKQVFHQYSLLFLCSININELNEKYSSDEIDRIEFVPIYEIEQKPLNGYFRSKWSRIKGLIENNNGIVDFD